MKKLQVFQPVVFHLHNILDTVFFIMVAILVLLC